MKVEVYEDKAGEWRWRRRADNGEIIATGEGYVDQDDCLSSATANFPDDVIDILETESEGTD